MKLCEVFSSSEGDMMPHDATAEQEVFNKTFAFFCVLLEKGCMFDVEKDGAQFEDVISGEHTDFEADSEEDSDTAWQQASGLCRGQMVICTDALGRPYIQYAHSRVLNLEIYFIPLVDASIEVIPIEHTVFSVIWMNLTQHIFERFYPATLRPYLGMKNERNYRDMAPSLRVHTQHHHRLNNNAAVRFQCL